MDYLYIIQKSLCYIEENITGALSLDTLSKQALISPFYYHRIFQSYTGIPVMEHIRKRRLTHASNDLINLDTSILDIALKYRFNSQDVFNRAFKRYYGVTPGKYKSLNKGSLIKNINTNVEEDFTMLNFELAKSLTLSNQDKKDCLELFGLIMELSGKARKYGLLSLEPEISKSQLFLMRKALQLVVDGVEPAYIKAILQNYIYAGNYQGRELLERLLVSEGILAIQAGTNPLLIQEKLSSYFGEDFSEEIDIFFGKGPDSINEKIQAYINAVKDSNPISPSTSLLEDPVQKLGNRSLQRLLRELEIGDLILAAKGSSGTVQGLIINNTSKKMANILVDELEALKQPVIHQITESQTRVLETLSKLKADREIV